MMYAPSRLSRDRCLPDCLALIELSKPSVSQAGGPACPPQRLAEEGHSLFK